MKRYGYVAAASMTALISTTALAAITNLNNLPKDGIVTLQGTVEAVQNEREFILRDDAGKTIGIDIDEGKSVVLKKGDPVTVTGAVDRGFLGTDINASSVSVGKGLIEGMSDTVKSMPGVSTLSAQAFDIKDLPQQGAVKVTGTVTDVDSEQAFTLQDETGSIDVAVTSNERAQLSEGAKVTVIGSVDHGAMGKNIHASQVLVVAN